MAQRTCQVCRAVVTESDVRCPVCTTVLHTLSYTGPVLPEKTAGSKKAVAGQKVKKCPHCSVVQDAALKKCRVCGFTLEKTQAYSDNASPVAVYTGFNLRFLAMLIDTAMILAVVLPCALLLYGDAYFTPDPFIKGPIDVLITWVLPGLAVIVFWIVWGATPGKMFIGARIVDAGTGKPARPLQLILRYYAYVLSALPLFAGFVAIANDAKKQGWHDRLSGTVVIQSKRSDRNKSR